VALPIPREIPAGLVAKSEDSPVPRPANKWIPLPPKYNGPMLSKGSKEREWEWVWGYGVWSMGMGGPTN